MPKLQDYEIEEQYKNMLDDCYGTVMIAGMEYDTSRAFYELDPIAYRVGLSDYEASTECNDCDEMLSDCTCEEE
jgi:hypothetical protein